VVAPWFGADAADLPTMDDAMSADVTASIANDAAKLPSGSYAITRGDPMAAGLLGGVLHTARRGGFLNTVVTTAPQGTGYLIEHAAPAQHDLEQLIGAGLQARAAQPDASRSPSQLAEPLTPAELRVLKLLPTSTYLQMAEVLYVSRNTVKTHLRSIYQELGVESRSQAIERAVELRLL
jgi:LuxR family transcriptional regulator, maltose regulon positive regulatory protein